MSTNCVRCIKRQRNGPDMLCEYCREIAADLMRPRTAEELKAQRDALALVAMKCLVGLHVLRNTLKAAKLEGEVIVNILMQEIRDAIKK